jgi:hypothetical protein
MANIDEDDIVVTTDSESEELEVEPLPREARASYSDRQYLSQDLQGDDSMATLDVETNDERLTPLVLGMPAPRDTRYEWFSYDYKDDALQQDDSVEKLASGGETFTPSTSDETAVQFVSEDGCSEMNGCKDEAKSQRSSTVSTSGQVDSSMLPQYLSFTQNRGADFQRRTHHAVMAIVRMQARHEQRKREAEAAIIERASRAARVVAGKMALADTKTNQYRGFQATANQSSLAELSKALSNSLEVGGKNKATHFTSTAIRNKGGSLDYDRCKRTVTADANVGTRTPREAQAKRPRFFSFD